MLLAIDTATRWSGLALYDGREVLAEHGWRSRRNQTVELAPSVGQMLTRAELGPADLTGIAVTIGPGSYTGLRVGLGFAKGMSLALGIPLLGVPTLDVVGAALPEMPGELVIVAEAGRSRVLAGRYGWERRHGWLAQDTPVVRSWDALLDETPPPVTFAGEISPAGARLIRSRRGAFQLLPPATNLRRAAFLATLAWGRLRRGRTDDAAALSPTYLRAPAGA